MVLLEEVLAPCEASRRRRRTEAPSRRKIKTISADSRGEEKEPASEPGSGLRVRKREPLHAKMVHGNYKKEGLIANRIWTQDI